jgi:hypothetical protein
VGFLRAAGIAGGEGDDDVKISAIWTSNSGGKVQILGTQTEEHGGILVWGRRRIAERRVWARIGQMHARVGRSQTPGEAHRIYKRWRRDDGKRTAGRQGNRLATRTVTCHAKVLITDPSEPLELLDQTHLYTCVTYLFYRIGLDHSGGYHIIVS